VSGEEKPPHPPADAGRWSPPHPPALRAPPSPSRGEGNKRAPSYKTPLPFSPPLSPCGRGLRRLGEHSELSRSWVRGTCGGAERCSSPTGGHPHKAFTPTPPSPIKGEGEQGRLRPVVLSLFPPPSRFAGHDLPLTLPLCGPLPLPAGERGTRRRRATGSLSPPPCPSPLAGEGCAGLASAASLAGAG